MRERIGMQSLSSRSDNRKSKIQNRKLVGVFAIVVALTVCGVRAEAQQAAKISRIGLLNTNFSEAFTARTEGFRQGLRELGYIEGKNNFGSLHHLKIVSFHCHFDL